MPLIVVFCPAVPIRLTLFLFDFYRHWTASTLRVHLIRQQEKVSQGMTDLIGFSLLFPHLHIVNEQPSRFVSLPDFKGWTWSNIIQNGFTQTPGSRSTPVPLPLLVENDSQYHPVPIARA